MRNELASILLAVQPSTLDKLRHVPAHSWANLAILLAGVFVTVRFWRTLRRVNEYAPYFATAVVAAGVFFYWVYSRTEPAFLTPVVERVAPFFPSEATQQQNIEAVRKARREE